MTRDDARDALRMLSTRGAPINKAHFDFLMDIADYEQCDDCGRILDKMQGEDFYIESENKVLCDEHYQEWRERNDGRNDKSD